MRKCSKANSFSLLCVFVHDLQANRLYYSDCNQRVKEWKRKTKKNNGEERLLQTRNKPIAFRFNTYYYSSRIKSNRIDRCVCVCVRTMHSVQKSGAHTYEYGQSKDVIEPFSDAFVVLANVTCRSFSLYPTSLSVFLLLVFSATSWMFKFTCCASLLFIMHCTCVRERARAYEQLSE